MVVKTKPNPKSGSRFGWRGFAVFVLSFIGLTSLVVFSITHWTDRQLLTTDNWVKLVAPIPKNNEVATSLSDYAVNRLFDKTNLDQKIAEALPPNASFLAEPLSNQLEQRTKNRAKEVVQSDKFQGLWVNANRIAHKKLVDRARADTNAPAPKGSTRFNLDLSSLGSSIREKLGNRSSPLFQNDAAPSTQENKVGLAVSLKTSFSKFKQFVNAVDFLNGVLGILAVACVLWALAISKNRRRLLMILSTAMAAVSLLQIIGVKSLRPVVLNQIETQSYRPAVGVVYDSLVATFERGATLIFIFSFLIFAVSFLVGYSRLTKHKQTVSILRSIKSHQLYKQLKQIRKQAGKYRYSLMGGAVFAVLIVLAAMSGYDWQGIIRAILFAFILCAVIRLFALMPGRTTRKSPM
jgi:hypothetical protein